MKTEEFIKIKCPQCGHVQDARVKKTLPFSHIYIFVRNVIIL